jgi:hypothetical protein
MAGVFGATSAVRAHLRRQSQPELTLYQGQPLAAHFPSQQRAVRPRTDFPRAPLCGAAPLNAVFGITLRHIYAATRQMLANWAHGPVTKEALNAIDITASRCYRPGVWKALMSER